MKINAINLMKRFAGAVGNLSVSLRDGMVILLTALIAWADIATPSYIFLTGYYLLTIFFAIWYCRKITVILVIAISYVTTIYMTTQDIPTGAPFWQLLLAYSSISFLFLVYSLLTRYLRIMVKHLKEENQTDALTGLRSRRNFLSLAQFEISRATRNPYPFTLALIDLDNFKLINDTHGHAIGDQLLIATANCMQSTLR